MAGIIGDLTDRQSGRGVSVYSPTRPVIRPTGTVANAGTSRRVTPRATTSSSTSMQWAADLSSRGGGNQGGNPGGWQGALGTAVNSVPGRLAMGALNVLDIPRRITVSGIQEGVDALNGGDASWDDFTSQVGDSNFGFGNVIGDTGNVWVNRALGFTGDVLLDPMTYVAGAGVISGTGRGARLTAAGAAAGIEGISEATIEQVARRGAGSVDNATRQLLRDAGIQIRDAGYYFKVPFSETYLRLPGTQIADRVVGSVGQRVRDSMANTSIGSWLRRMNTDEMLNESVERLITGAGSLSARSAAGVYTYRNSMRLVGRTVTREFESEAERIIRSVGPKGLSAALHEAETQGTGPIAEFFENAARLLDEKGVRHGTIRNSAGRAAYAPHMATPEFTAWLEGADPAAQAMRGFFKGIDMTTGSPSLMTRTLVPRAEPYMINGQEFRVTEGTIAEFNQQFAKIAPNAKFKMFEDDFAKIASRYAQGIGNDVGKVAGVRKLMDTGLLRNADDKSLWTEVLDEAETKILNDSTGKALKAQRRALNKSLKELREQTAKGVAPIQGMLATQLRGATAEMSDAVPVAVRTEIDALLVGEEEKLKLINAGQADAAAPSPSTPAAKATAAAAKAQENPAAALTSTLEPKAPKAKPQTVEQAATQPGRFEEVLNETYDSLHGRIGKVEARLAQIQEEAAAAAYRETVAMGGVEAATRAAGAAARSEALDEWRRLSVELAQLSMDRQTVVELEGRLLNHRAAAAAVAARKREQAGLGLFDESSAGYLSFVERTREEELEFAERMPGELRRTTPSHYDDEGNLVPMQLERGRVTVGEDGRLATVREPPAGSGLRPGDRIYNDRLVSGTQPSVVRATAADKRAAAVAGSEELTVTARNVETARVRVERAEMEMNQTAGIWNPTIARTKERVEGARQAEGEMSARIDAMRGDPRFVDSVHALQADLERWRSGDGGLGMALADYSAAQRHLTEAKARYTDARRVYNQWRDHLAQQARGIDAERAATRVRRAEERVAGELDELVSKADEAMTGISAKMDEARAAFADANANGDLAAAAKARDRYFAAKRDLDDIRFETSQRRKRIIAQGDPEVQEKFERTVAPMAAARRRQKAAQARYDQLASTAAAERPAVEVAEGLTAQQAAREHQLALLSQTKNAPLERAKAELAEADNAVTEALTRQQSIFQRGIESYEFQPASPGSYEGTIRSINANEDNAAKRAAAQGAPVKIEWEEVPRLPTARQTLNKRIGPELIVSADDRLALQEAYDVIRTAPPGMRGRDNPLYQSAKRTIRDIEQRVDSTTQNMLRRIRERDSYQLAMDEFDQAKIPLKTKPRSSQRRALESATGMSGGATELPDRARAAADGLAGVLEEHGDELLQTGAITSEMHGFMARSHRELNALMDSYALRPDAQLRDALEQKVADVARMGSYTLTMQRAVAEAMEPSSQLSALVLGHTIKRERESLESILRQIPQRTDAGMEAKLADYSAKVMALETEIGDFDARLAEVKTQRLADPEDEELRKLQYSLTAKIKARLARLAKTHANAPDVLIDSGDVEAMTDYIHRMILDLRSADQGLAQARRRGNAGMLPPLRLAELDAEIPLLEASVDTAMETAMNVRRAISAAVVANSNEVTFVRPLREAVTEDAESWMSLAYDPEMAIPAKHRKGIERRASERLKRAQERGALNPVTAERDRELTVRLRAEGPTQPETMTLEDAAHLANSLERNLKGQVTTLDKYRTEKMVLTGEAVEELDHLRSVIRDRRTPPDINKLLAANQTTEQAATATGGGVSEAMRRQMDHRLERIDYATNGLTPEDSNKILERIHELRAALATHRETYAKNEAMLTAARDGGQDYMRSLFRGTKPWTQHDINNVRALVGSEKGALYDAWRETIDRIEARFTVARESLRGRDPLGATSKGIISDDEIADVGMQIEAHFGRTGLGDKMMEALMDARSVAETTHMVRNEQGVVNEVAGALDTRSLDPMRDVLATAAIEDAARRREEQLQMASEVLDSFGFHVKGMSVSGRVYTSNSINDRLRYFGYTRNARKSAPALRREDVRSAVIGMLSTGGMLPQLSIRQKVENLRARIGRLRVMERSLGFSSGSFSMSGEDVATLLARVNWDSVDGVASSAETMRNLRDIMRQLPTEQQAEPGARFLEQLLEAATQARATGNTAEAERIAAQITALRNPQMASATPIEAVPQTAVPEVPSPMAEVEEAVTAQRAIEQADILNDAELETYAQHVDRAEKELAAVDGQIERATESATRSLDDEEAIRNELRQISDAEKIDMDKPADFFSEADRRLNALDLQSLLARSEAGEDVDEMLEKVSALSQYMRDQAWQLETDEAKATAKQIAAGVDSRPSAEVAALNEQRQQLQSNLEQAQRNYESRLNEVSADPEPNPYTEPAAGVVGEGGADPMVAPSTTHEQPPGTAAPTTGGQESGADALIAEYDELSRELQGMIDQYGSIDKAPPEIAQAMGEASLRLRAISQQRNAVLSRERESVARATPGWQATADQYNEMIGGKPAKPAITADAEHILMHATPSVRTADQVFAARRQDRTARGMMLVSETRQRGHAGRLFGGDSLLPTNRPEMPGGYSWSSSKLDEIEGRLAQKISDTEAELREISPNWRPTQEVTDEHYSALGRAMGEGVEIDPNDPAVLAAKKELTKERRAVTRLGKERSAAEAELAELQARRAAMAREGVPGAAQGDELPAHLRSPENRQAMIDTTDERIAELIAQREAAGGAVPTTQRPESPVVSTMPETAAPSEPSSIWKQEPGAAATPTPPPAAAALTGRKPYDYSKYTDEDLDDLREMLAESYGEMVPNPDTGVMGRLPKVELDQIEQQRLEVADEIRRRAEAAAPAESSIWEVAPGDAAFPDPAAAAPPAAAVVPPAAAAGPTTKPPWMWADEEIRAEYGDDLRLVTSENWERFRADGYPGSDIARNAAKKNGEKVPTKRELAKQYEAEQAGSAAPAAAAPPKPPKPPKAPRKPRTPRAQTKAQDAIDSKTRQMEEAVPDLATTRRNLALARHRDRNDLSVLERKLDKNATTAELRKTHQDLLSVINDLDADVLDEDTANQLGALFESFETNLAGLEGMEQDYAKISKRLDDFARGSRIVGNKLTDVIIDGWEQMQSDLLPTGESLIINSQLKRGIDNLNRAMVQPETWKMLDKFTQFFKTYATAKPGFHVRNLMSSMFMNLVDRVQLRQMPRAWSLWTKFADNPAEFMRLARRDNPKVYQAFQAVFGSGAAGQWLEEGMGGVEGIGARAYGKLMDNKLTRWNQRAGARVEGSMRLAMALDSIDKGMSVEAALGRITHYHFDYTEMSKLDRTARKLIPFWTFVSRNFPLQIESMWLRPRTYLQYQSFTRNFREAADPLTPGYWLDQGAFTMNEDAEGTDSPWYLSPDLPHTRVAEPLNALAEGDLGKAFLSDINPAIIAPIEAFAAGKKFYTGAPIEENYSEPDAVQQRLMWLFKMLGGTEEGGTTGHQLLDDRYAHVASTMLPPLELLQRLAGNTGTRTGRQDETIARLFGLPVLQLTPQMRDSTRRTNYYDQLDELEQRRDLARS